ncbi:Gfo/Idh/MocA family oxidoreductase [Gammaproteobacteria bacterium]|jgi:predicted dehydrogenase|nr:Gfo/Idh/MocA family oxidoreductase [Gammaproteobacteria bacterium]
MIKKKVQKILLIGLGSIGQRHARLLKELFPEIDLIALTSKKEHHLQSGIDYLVNNLEEAIAMNPQAAIICNPASEHLSTAIPLAKKGIHLLIEKPVSNKLQHTNKLLKIVEEKKIKVLIGYNLRFLESMQIFKNEISKKNLGTIYSIRSEVGQDLQTWRPGSDYKDAVSAKKKLGGGVLLELSHEIDYLTWIFGRIDWVYGYIDQVSKLKIDVEDLAQVLLKFTPNSHHNLVANVTLDFIRKDRSRNCTVIGEKGTLMWDGILNEVNLYKNGSWNNIYRLKLDPDSSYKAELNHFIDCIERNRPPVSSLSSAIECLKIIDNIVKSSLKKESILVNY